MNSTPDDLFPDWPRSEPPARAPGRRRAPAPDAGHASSPGTGRESAPVLPGVSGPAPAPSAAPASARSPAERLAAPSRVVIGTSGYSFPDWVGPFYPAGTPRTAMLACYAERFPAVEVNATYYRIPPPRTLEQMEAKTPPAFEFMVKLFQGMTHEAATDPQLYRDFHAALEPLRRAGKLRGLLAQFPWAFRYGEEGLRHLEFLRHSFPEDSLHVEFRRSEWDRPEALGFLQERGIGYCCVDEPSLPGLMPARAAATTEIGYVRLHGRNAANWWGRGGGDRYDYDYSEAELREWLARIRELAAKTARTYVFFNNCHAGHAAANAMLMQEMLQREGLGL
ncbi:MAG TPA: DUF72 domain-containing protein [Candidatus Saccharimonadales bacterium]|nr:DUF72 domain-containing protein [Candidatus Saccharimonadales bacterium]